jgi:hypothetical protein
MRLLDLGQEMRLQTHVWYLDSTVLSSNPLSWAFCDGIANPAHGLTQARPPLGFPPRASTPIDKRERIPSPRTGTHSSRRLNPAGSS